LEIEQILLKLSGQNFCYIYSLIRENFESQTHKKIISFYHSYFQGKEQHKWRQEQKNERKERKEKKEKISKWNMKNEKK